MKPSIIVYLFITKSILTFETIIFCLISYHTQGMLKRIIYVGRLYTCVIWSIQLQLFIDSRQMDPLTIETFYKIKWQI